MKGKRKKKTNKQTTKKNKKDTKAEKNKGDKSYSESVRAK